MTDNSQQSRDLSSNQHIADRLRKDAAYIEGRTGHEERRALMREAAGHIDQLEQDIAQLTSPDETSDRQSQLIARLRRISSLNDNPAHFVDEIDKLTYCGKFIAPDEYCEKLIGHEGRCGLLPGNARCREGFCAPDKMCVLPAGHSGEHSFVTPEKAKASTP